MPVVILALDLATVTGFAIGRADGSPRLGTWRLGASGATRGERGLKLLRELNDLFKIERPDRIVYEAPMTPRVMVDIGTKPEHAILLLGLCMVVETVATSRGIYQVGPANVQDAREHFCGKRTFAAGYDPLRKRKIPSRDMAKAAVIAQCRVMGWNVDGDDQADAACLWSYEAARVKPSRAAGVTPLFSGVTR
jgi:hypothetical protein